MKPQTRGFRRLCIFIAIFAAMMLTLLLCHRPILTKIGSLPILEDRLEPSDLIIVMSGGLPEIHYGVDLYHQGYAPKLLFLGHFPVELAVLQKEPFEVIEGSWDKIAAHLAVNGGVLAKDILYSDAFDSSTYERVHSALEVARKNNVRSAIFVSNLMHSRRVKFSAEKILKGSPPKIILAPVPQSYFPEAYRFDVESWWTDESDLKGVVGEYISLIFYWFKYGP